MNRKLAYMLQADDFSCLVSGGTLTIKAPKIEIKIALSDIGYHHMARLMFESQVTGVPYPNKIIELRAPLNFKKVMDLLTNKE